MRGVIARRGLLAFVRLLFLLVQLLLLFGLPLAHLLQLFIAIRRQRLRRNRRIRSGRCGRLALQRLAFELPVFDPLALLDWRVRASGLVSKALLPVTGVALTSVVPPPQSYSLSPRYSPLGYWPEASSSGPSWSDCPISPRGLRRVRLSSSPMGLWIMLGL